MLYFSDDIFADTAPVKTKEKKKKTAAKSAVNTKPATDDPLS